LGWGWSIFLFHTIATTLSFLLYLVHCHEGGEENE